MGRIKVHEVSGNIGNVPAPALSNARFSASDFGGAVIGDALKTAGAAFQAVQKKKLSDERVDAVDALNKFQFDMAQFSAEQEKAQLLTGGDARDHVGNVMTAFNERAALIGEGTDPSTQDFIRNRIGTYRNSAFSTANKFGASAAGKHRVGVLKATSDGLLSQAYTANTPEEVRPLVSNYDDAARALGISGDRLDDSSDTQAGILSAQAVKGVLDRSSPEEAKRIGEELKNGTSEWLGMLAGKDVDNLAKYARSRSAAGEGAIKGNQKLFGDFASQSNLILNANSPQPVPTEYLDGMKESIKLMDGLDKVVAIKRYDRINAQSTVLSGFKKLSLPAMRGVEGLLRADAEGSNDASKIETSIMARKYLKTFEKESTRPVDYGISRRIVRPIDPKVLDNPDTLAVALSDRAKQMEAVGTALGSQPKEILSKSEVQTFTNKLRLMDPVRRAAAFSELTKASGPNWANTLKSFSKTYPGIGVMGSLALLGRDEDVGVISQGADLVSKNAKLIDSAEYKQLTSKIGGSVFNLLRETDGASVREYTDAVLYHYIGSGGDNTSTNFGLIKYNKSKLDESISAVFGHSGSKDGYVTTGNSTKTFLPPSVSKDDFEVLKLLDSDTTLDSLQTSGGRPQTSSGPVSLSDLTNSFSMVIIPGRGGGEPGDVSYGFKDSGGSWVADSLSRGKFRITLSDERVDSLFFSSEGDE